MRNRNNHAVHNMGQAASDEGERQYFYASVIRGDLVLASRSAGLPKEVVRQIKDGFGLCEILYRFTSKEKRDEWVNSGVGTLDNMAENILRDGPGNEDIQEAMYRFSLKDDDQLVLITHDGVEDEELRWVRFRDCDLAYDSDLIVEEVYDNYGERYGHDAPIIK